MRKRAVLPIAAAAVIVAGVTVVVAARTVGQHSSAQAAVSAQHGGSVSFGEASLTVPAGAVSGSGQLLATTAGPPPAGYPAGALIGASAPVHFSVTGGAKITGTLLITFRVPAAAVPGNLPRAAAASAVWLAFYDPAAGRWQATASSYDPASGTVTARVTHLSWWMPWTWDWAGMALRARQALSAFGSGRAPAVSCPKVPGVTVTSAGGQDPPMIGCAAKTGTDTLAITLTNNRGLSMVMSADPPGAKPGPPSYSGFYQYVATSAAATAMLGGADLPPEGTRTYTLPLRGGPAGFNAAPTVSSYILDLAAVAADTLIGKAKFQKVSGDYAKCAIDAVARTAKPSLDNAADLAVTCLPVLADQIPGYTDLVKVIGKKALAVLQLAINDIKLLLQDGDLIYDQLRGIQGNVSIARPSPVSMCTPAALTKALIAANPQLNSYSWNLRSYACESGWAVAQVYAPAVGPGTAFLQQTASGWKSDALGEVSCSQIPGPLGTPLPTQALTVSLLSKAGICANTSQPAGRPAGYDKYTNLRYGFTVFWPSSFRAQPPPANGDGQTWTSPDGQVLLSVYGTNNLSNYSPGQDEAIDARSMSVVYDNISGNVVTLSGYKNSGRTIVYQRDVVGPGAIDTLYWSYPASGCAR